MRSIADNIRKVQDEIASACGRVGRDPSEVTLVAVTKGVSVERIRDAIAAGLNIFGENRVQEATAKIAALSDNLPLRIRWHMVGHLQTNKARKAVELFDMIQSLDSLKLARKLDAYAAEHGKIIPVLIEVNVGGEETKHGVRPEELGQLVEAVAKLENIKVRGLMTVPPYLDDPEDVRPYFRRLRELAEEIKRADFPHVQMVHLSMGMSHDFQVAVEEGATMVRIGTAIFGSGS